VRGGSSLAWFVLAPLVNVFGGARDRPAEESLGRRLGKLGGRERGTPGVLAAEVKELGLGFPWDWECLSRAFVFCIKGKVGS